MKANQGFSDDILAVFRESKGLRIRAGTRPHRFIGIWLVVVNDCVFVRSWSVKPRGGTGRSSRNLAELCGSRIVRSQCVP